MPPILQFQGLPVREFLLVAVVAAVVTYLATGVVRALAVRFGAVAWPRVRDVHVSPTPRWGGWAMLGGVLGGIAVAGQLPALRLAFSYSSEVMGLLVAGGLLVLVGALDDRFELDSFTKLAGQATAAGVLVLFGVQWALFPIPWGGNGTSPGATLSFSNEQAFLVSMLIILALVNGINLIDGLDGLAAGVGCIAASATFMYSIGLLSKAGNDPNAYTPALIAALLAGACVGFLPHNFNPSRIFMGDSGSMLIGIMLATATTTASGRVTDFAGRDVVGLMAPVLVVAAVVFVPLADLLLALVRRTRSGGNLFAPDKMHLHHRLLELGHSHRRVVLLIYLWSGILAFGAVVLALTGALVVLVVTAVLAVPAACMTAGPWFKARLVRKRLQSANDRLQLQVERPPYTRS